MRPGDAVAYDISKRVVTLRRAEPLDVAFHAALERTLDEWGSPEEVPALWPLEVANALTVLQRRLKLTEDEKLAGLGWLRGLPLRIDHEMALLAFSRLAELASAHRLSVYDAAYLELGQRRRLVLGCKDGPLRTAARRAGVGLWG